MAQRVNTKFIVIAVTTVLAIGAGGYLVRHFVRSNPKPHIELGDKMMAEGQLEQARVEYGLAFQLDRRNAEVAWKLGNVIQQLMKTDDSYNVRQVESFWTASLEADPSYKPALVSLLDIRSEEAKAAEDAKAHEAADFFTKLKDTADKLLSIDPKNPKALTYQHIASIMTWTYGGTEGDSNQILADIDALHALMITDPDNPDPPLYIAKAYINQGTLKLRNDSPPAEAHEDFQRAVTIFDEAIKNSPNNAKMDFASFTVHRQVAAIDTVDADPKARFTEEKDLILKAISLVKPVDAEYRTIYYAGQDFARKNKDFDWAEKLIREWTASRPDDPFARLLLAQTIDTQPKRRAEAIQVLSTPLAPTKAGFPLIPDRRNLELASILELCSMRLELYPYVGADEQKQLLQQVGDGLQEATERSSAEDWRVTMLKGRLTMLQHGEGSLEAEQLLSKALEQRHMAEGDNDDADKYKIMYWLACCYASLNQTGAAESYLYEVIDKAPEYVPARLRLAHLLVQNNATLQARAQIDALWKQIPDNLDLIRLKLDVLDLSVDADKQQAAQLYAKLPESTSTDMNIKAQAAARLQMNDEALRLTRAVWEKDGADFESLRRLVQVLQMMNKKDDAVNVATKAVQDNPKDSRFELLLAVLKSAPPDQLDEIRKRIITAEPDARSRELEWFEFYQQRGNADEAFAHLQSAEKLAPDDPAIIDLMFQHWVQVRDWNKASDSATRLGAVNFDGAHGLLYQIELAKQEGKYDEQLSLSRDVAKQFPELARSWIAIGDAMKVTKQYDIAIQNYTLALEKQKDSAAAYRGLIECSEAMGRLDDARRYLNSALKLHPDDPVFRESMVELDLQTDPEQAIRPRQQALADNPRSADAHINLGQAYFKAGIFLQQKGDNDKAMEYFKNARDVLTQLLNDPQWSEDPRSYEYLAEIAIAMKDFDGGKAVLQKLAATEKWKDTPVPGQLLARYYVQCNKLPEAEAAWKDALEKSHDADEILQQLADFYTQHGRVDDAIALLTPHRSDAKMGPYLVEIEINSRHYVEAQHHIEEMIKAAPADQPRNPTFVSWLGLTLLNENKYPDALALLNEAIGLAPKNPLPYLWRAQVKMKQPVPDLDAADQDLKAALDLDPNNVDVRVSLAELYQRRDDMESAMQQLDQAVKSAPGRKDIRLNLVNMYLAQTPPRWVEIGQLLDDARRGDPNDLTWIVQQADVAIQRGMPDVAVQRAEEMLKLGQANPTVISEFLTILLRAKQFERTISETTAMINTNKDQTPWWVYMNRGVALANLDRKDEAMQDFKTALDLTANAAGADNIARQVIQRMVEVVGPQRALDFALPQTGSDYRWRFIVADLYDRKFDYPDAAAMADKMLADKDKLSPAERARMLVELAQIYIHDKDVQKGVQLYQQMLVDNPDNVLALNNLAIALVDDTDPPQPEQALTYTTRLLNEALPKEQAIFSSDQYNFLDTHGWVLVKCHHETEGLPYLYAAANANISSACYHLGVVLLGQSRVSDARRWLQSAHDLMQKDVDNQQPYDPVLRAAIDAELSHAEELPVSSDAH